MAVKFGAKSMKKMLAVVLSVSMIVPQNIVYAAEGTGDADESGLIQLTDADIESLYQKVSVQRQSVHDPSIIVNVNNDGTKKYYVFGSHMGVAKTDDLRNWSATDISDQVETNAYYGVRDESGNVTAVSYEAAFTNNFSELA